MKQLLTLTLFLGICVVSHAGTIPVSINHPVYDFIDRMETQKKLPFVLDDTLPLTRRQIGVYLNELIEVSQDSVSHFSSMELRYLEYYAAEFFEEFENRTSANPSVWQKLVRHKWIDPWIPDAIYSNGRNFYSFSEGPLTLHFDPVFYRERLYIQADTIKSRKHVFQNTNGFRIWGSIGDHFGFITDVRDTKEWGNDSYPNQRNYSYPGVGFVRGFGDHIYHDENRALIQFDYTFFSLLFGKNLNRWGVGERYQLFLSDQNVTSYDFLKMGISSSKLRFTSMIAWMKHYHDSYFYGNPTTKLFVAHRLEWAPLSFLRLGVHESVVFRGRSFDPQYLNPVIFLRSAEHYLGDRDNALIGMDFELRPIAGYKLFVELLVDDLKTSKLGTDYYGNKYGYLIGTEIADAGGLPNSNLRVEYSYVRPFTYTHKDSILSYSHFTGPLGHELGPNHESLTARLSYDLMFRMKSILEYQRIRKGYNLPGQNVGGNLFEAHDSRYDNETIPFLDGRLESVQTVSLSLSYTLMRHATLAARVCYKWGQSHKTMAPVEHTDIVFQINLNH